VARICVRAAKVLGSERAAWRIRVGVAYATERDRRGNMTGSEPDIFVIARDLSTTIA